MRHAAASPKNTKTHRQKCGDNPSSSSQWCLVILHLQLQNHRSGPHYFWKYIIKLLHSWLHPLLKNHIIIFSDTSSSAFLKYSQNIQSPRSTFPYSHHLAGWMIVMLQDSVTPLNTCAACSCADLIKRVCLKMVYTPNYSHLIGIMIINHWV